MKKNDAASKPNRGQDEKLHTIQAPDGTRLDVTQREWKETYRGQGYTRVDDDGDEAPDVPEAPEVTPAPENEA